MALTNTSGLLCYKLTTMDCWQWCTVVNEKFASLRKVLFTQNHCKYFENCLGTLFNTMKGIADSNCTSYFSLNMVFSTNHRHFSVA